MKPPFAILIFFAFSLAACGLSIPFPKIKGDPMSQTGKTDSVAVRCTLRVDKSNARVISRELVVAKNFLAPDLGVNLAVTDGKGGLVASWEIAGREKEGKIHYYFALRKDLVDSAKFSLFTKENGMMELHLRTVRITK